MPRSTLQNPGRLGRADPTPFTGMQSKWSQWIAPALLIGLFLAASFGGGSNEWQRVGLVPLRLLAFIALLIVGWQACRSPIPDVRPGVVFAGLAAILVAIQLVPLPPAIWSLLPGRENYVAVAQAAGQADVWRPIALDTSRAINSLLHLAPPFAIYLLCMKWPRRSLDTIAVAVISLALVSGTLGTLQLVTDNPSLMFYGSGAGNISGGLLANKNHQAIFLSIAVVLAGAYGAKAGESHGTRNARRRVITAWMLVAVLALFVLVTRSRAGLASLAISLPMAAMFLGALNWKTIAAGVIGVGVLALALGLGARFEGDVGDDARIKYLPLVLDLARDNLPFGVGFGGFNPAFRHIEPDSILSPQFFNHAHSDLLEIIVEGGLPAFLLLIVAVVWIVRRTLAAYRADFSYGLAAGVGLSLALLASLVDYPFRAPLFAMVCAVLAAVLSIAPPRRSERGNRHDRPTGRDA